MLWVMARALAVMSLGQSRRKCCNCPVILSAMFASHIWTFDNSLIGADASDDVSIRGAWDVEDCRPDQIEAEAESNISNMSHDLTPFEHKYVPFPFQCPSNTNLGATVLDVIDPQDVNCSIACDDLPGCVGFLNNSETSCSLLGPPPGADFIIIGMCDRVSVVSSSVTFILHEWWRLPDFVEADMSQPPGVVKAAWRPSTAGGHAGDGQRYRSAPAGTVQQRAAVLAQATAAHAGASFGCGMQCLERSGCAAFGVLWVDGAPCSFRDRRRCDGCCQSSRGCDAPVTVPVREPLTLQIESMPQRVAEMQQAADAAQQQAAADAADEFCERGGFPDNMKAEANASHDACCDEILRLDIITPACRRCVRTGLDNFGVPNSIPCCGASRCPGAVLPP